jgi:uncharacterized protein (DUF433 family)
MDDYGTWQAQTVRADMMGGSPCVPGTRLTCDTVVSYVLRGDIHALLEDYQYLTAEDIVFCLLQHPIVPEVAHHEPPDLPRSERPCDAHVLVAAQALRYMQDGVVADWAFGGHLRAICPEEVATLMTSTHGQPEPYHGSDVDRVIHSLLETGVAVGALSKKMHGAYGIASPREAPLQNIREALNHDLDWSEEPTPLWGLNKQVTNLIHENPHGLWAVVWALATLAAEGKVTPGPKGWVLRREEPAALDVTLECYECGWEGQMPAARYSTRKHKPSCPDCQEDKGDDYPLYLKR